MAFRPIVLWPDSLLRTKAEPVAQVTDETRTLIADLWQTMREARGAGLAAPQIGVLQRVIVVDVVYADEKTAPIAMVNPVIALASETKEIYNEACLSLPNQSWDVERPSRILVNYLDEQGQEKTLEATGVQAVAIQHEIDHLDGKVYVDHLSTLKRDLARKKAQKFQRGLKLMQQRRNMEIGRLQQMGVLPADGEKR